MVVRNRFSRVNWVDGMKLNSAHLNESDNYFDERIQDSIGLFVNDLSYGLLPPVKGESSSLDMHVESGADGSLKVTLVSCNAITLYGERINIAGKAGNNDPDPGAVACTLLPQKEVESYDIVLSVSADECTYTGAPDPGEIPLRFPGKRKKLHLSVMPSAKASHDAPFYLLLGRIAGKEEGFVLDAEYIPPCSCMLADPRLMQYFDKMSKLLSSIQYNCQIICRKIGGQGAYYGFVTHIYELCRKIAELAAAYSFAYRSRAPLSSPVFTVEVFAAIAGAVLAHLNCISDNKRDELLNYFAEWADTTPVLLERVLRASANIEYAHTEIGLCMKNIAAMATVIDSLFERIGTLDRIGIRRGNIVIGESRAGRRDALPGSKWKIID